MTACLKVKCSGTSMVTSNLGKTYSATKKALWKTWSSTVTVMFQSPSTGDSDSWNSDENTPRVVSALLQCFTRLPLPSFTNKQQLNSKLIINKLYFETRLFKWPGMICSDVVNVEEEVIRKLVVFEWNIQYDLNLVLINLRCIGIIPLKSLWANSNKKQ